tara:strand:+ start:27 stop:566 length:540 start_codon:yes stop_codon:yes gene_type:complete
MAKFIRLTDEDTVRNLCSIATEVMELPQEILSSATRKQSITLPRMVVSNICRQEHGIHHEVIAHVLNRDRCSIYHYEKQHDNLMVWAPYRNTYWKIIKEYTRLELVDKLKFNSTACLRNFLKEEGINFRMKNPQVHIEVTTPSNSNKILIPSTFMDFSDVVKKLKTILQSYEHKIQVNL